MEYRVLPHGGEKISVIGMGASVIGARPEGEIIATVQAAIARGVNFFDLAGGPRRFFPPMARRCRDCARRSICRFISARITPAASTAGRRI